MKKLIYLWLLASVLLPVACTDDDDVFSEESGVRLQTVIDECKHNVKGGRKRLENGVLPESGQLWRLYFSFQVRGEESGTDDQ